MNKSRQTLFKTLAPVLCLISMGWAYGQKETKTYNETFRVSKDAVLNIDTSHADIEFETWGKDEVVVEAVIEIEGASAEEVQRYFEKESFEILGNSNTVEIKTKGGNTWLFGDSTMELQNFEFEFEMPELPEMDDIDIAFEINELPEIAEMPEVPMAPVPHFDYQAFKENREGYMEEWKKEFEKSFGKDYQKKMEDWGKRMELKQEEREKRQEELSKRFELRAEERGKLMEERAEERVKRLEEVQKRREEHAERIVNRNRIHISRSASDEPNIFYYSTDGENKNYKVKKTIKIKMPKGMKIKMDVRHGEVKLADNTMHMNAKLSHSSLWAASIDGDKTIIKASYSPVSIDRWYLGNLQANYSESVNLKEVFDIRLNTTSSNVKIDKLIKTALIKNDFGQLKIGSITKDFTDLDVSLQNAELDFFVPDVAFDIQINGTSSTLKSPATITLERTKNHSNTIHKGYNINKKAGRSIVINSKYSEVIMH